MHPATTALLIAVLALAGAGCGGSDAPKPTAPTPASTSSAGGRLSDDALLAVHDEFVTCVQQADSLGLAAHFSGGRAVSDSEGAGGGEYDDRVSAPKAIARLTKRGEAQYVGLRADTRNRSGTSDFDVLIFRSEEDAAARGTLLENEAGIRPDLNKLFVNVELHRTKPESSRMPSQALADCEARARP